MRKEDKKQLINSLTQQLTDNNNFYITDVSDLNAEDTSNLRRLCYKYNITMRVVKNTLLKKAMETADRNFEELYETLKGNTSIMFAEAGNARESGAERGHCPLRVSRCLCIARII